VSTEGDYAQVADAQLDNLEQGDDTDLDNAVLDAIDLIFRAPGQAQALSAATTTREGIAMRLPASRASMARTAATASPPSCES
jgi:hypothetical protein